MQIDKSQMLQNLSHTISAFVDELAHIPPFDISAFDANETIVVMIDMINGFCKFGALSSPNVEKLIPQMGEFLDLCIKSNIPILSYQDAHEDENAVEFRYYPSHCIKGSDESRLVDELQRPQIQTIYKNSTNGFLAKNPLELYKNAKNILLIGCVTDICVRDFSSTMSKYLQEKNINGDVFVVENLVDTYDIADIHDRQVEHVLALYHLKSSGVKFLRFLQK